LPRKRDEGGGAESMEKRRRKVKGAQIGKKSPCRKRGRSEKGDRGGEKKRTKIGSRKESGDENIIALFTRGLRRNLPTGGER